MPPLRAQAGGHAEGKDCVSWGQVLLALVAVAARCPCQAPQSPQGSMPPLNRSACTSASHCSQPLIGLLPQWVPEDSPSTPVLRLPAVMKVQPRRAKGAKWEPPGTGAQAEWLLAFQRQGHFCT